MKLTITEASKHSGIPDKTLYRWIAKGTLSCTKDALDRKVIDIAELERVANDRKPAPETTDSLSDQERLQRSGNRNTAVSRSLTASPDPNEMVPILENVKTPENTQPSTETTRLIAQLQSEIEFLRSQLETANTEKAMLLKAQSQITLALPKPIDEPETEPKRLTWRDLIPSFRTLI